MGFHASRKRRNLILEKKWPRNDINVEDDPYKTFALAYNREMDQLVVANIVNNEVEDENISGLDNEEENKGLETTHLGDTTIDSNEEKEKSMTPRLEMGSNDANNT
jgi:hypothetical protein